MSLSVSFPISFDRKISGLAGIFILGAVFITTFQDFLHAYFHHYTFYLSESLLYKAYFPLFFPWVLVQLFTIRKYLKNSRGIRKMLSIVAVILIPTVLHILTFSLVLFLISTLFFNHTYHILPSLAYTIREDLYQYLLVYGIMAYAGFIRKEAIPEEKSPDIPKKDVFPALITIRSGRKNRTIHTDDILYISSANPYIALHTSRGKYLHAASLKSMAAILGDRQFVRVHKSTLVNIKQIASYTSRLNGDYDITLLNGEVIRLSRHYTPSFRKHFL